MLTADMTTAAAALWHGACAHRNHAEQQRREFEVEGPNGYDLWAIQLAHLWADADLVKDLHRAVAGLYMVRPVPR